MSALTRLALLLASLVLLAAAPAHAQPPIWIVRSGHARLVLFGSIHVLPAGLDWRPAALTAALGEANDLWFELPIDEPTAEAAAAIAQARGTLPAGHTLSELLPAGDDARLARMAARLGLPVAALERMAPWRADVVLSLADDARLGALASQGVEAQVAAAVPPTVTRRAFETAAEQIGFLADMSRRDQIASLEQTLTQAETEPDLYARVVSAWMAGDVGTLERETLVPLETETPAVWRRLVLARNRRWARLLARRLQGHGEAVVVVGVDHLIGPDGVPALLRRAGFSVEGPLPAVGAPALTGRGRFP